MTLAEKYKTLLQEVAKLETEHVTLTQANADMRQALAVAKSTTLGLEVKVAFLQAELDKLSTPTPPNTTPVIFNTGGEARDVIIQPGNRTVTSNQPIQLKPGDYTVDRVSVPLPWVRDFTAPIAFTVGDEPITIDVMTKMPEPATPDPVTPKPDPVKPLDPDKRPVRRLDAPLTGTNILLEDLIIDYDARAISVAKGAKIVCRRCTFPKGRQAIDCNTTDFDITLEDCDFGVHDKHTLYVGTLGWHGDKIMGKVTIKRCTFKSSLYEAPVRFMQNTLAYVEDSDIYDTIDSGVFKANGGLRAHNIETTLVNTRSGLWTRLHPTSDSKNDPNEFMRSIVATDCKFDGGVRLAKGIKKLRMTRCILDATKGVGGWAIAKSREGVTKEQTLDAVLTDCLLMVNDESKVDRSIGQFIRCKLNDKVM